MLYKRPSLRRGGTPTGIETLEPRKKFEFGTPGFSFLEPGLQKELRAEAERKNKPTSFSKGLEKGQRIKSKITGLKRFLPTGSTLRQGLGFLRGVAPTAASLKPLALTAAIAAPVGGLMYLNRPRTQAELDFIKSQNQNLAFDYGMGPEFDDYLKERERLSKVGPKISFFDTFKTSQLDSDEPGEDDPTLDEGDSLSGIIDKVVSDKKTKNGKTEKKEKTEDSFQTEFNKQYNRLEKFLGANKSEDKGRLALALSEAVGTPGSISDKASVLNKSLLNIAAGRKKDKKDLTKLAFAAATEIEKANIAAGKKSFEERRYDKLLQNVNIINNPGNFSKEEVDEAKASIQNTSNLQELLKGSKGDFTLTGNTLTVAIDEAQKVQNKLEKELAKDNPDQSKIKKYRKSLKIFQALLNKDLSGISTALELKKGGRVNLAESFPGTAGEAANTEPATQTANIDKLSFNELRTRLPKEITDDIVVLLANDDQALQDFAYIRTQGDIDKFNLKYGVTLVLPPESA